MDEKLTGTIPFNWSQGSARRVVFVCSSGQLRSATAAHEAVRLYSWNTRCCGTHAAALQRLTGRLIDWADRVVFVHAENFRQAQEQFRGTEHEADLLRKSHTWSIEDAYNYGDDKLLADIRVGLKNLNSGPRFAP